jgi:hypothetical protein
MYKNSGAYKNLGVQKLLASTKHWQKQKIRHRQIIGVDKTLAHEKLGVGKI